MNVLVNFVDLVPFRPLCSYTAVWLRLFTILRVHPPPQLGPATSIDIRQQSCGGNPHGARKTYRPSWCAGRGPRHRDSDRDVARGGVGNAFRFANRLVGRRGYQQRKRRRRRPGGAFRHGPAGGWGVAAASDRCLGGRPACKRTHFRDRADGLIVGQHGRSGARSDRLQFRRRSHIERGQGVPAKAVGEVEVLRHPFVRRNIDCIGAGRIAASGVTQPDRATRGDVVGKRRTAPAALARPAPNLVAAEPVLVPQPTAAKSPATSLASVLAAVLAPFAGSGPLAPAASPALWVLAAAARRQFGPISPAPLPHRHRPSHQPAAGRDRSTAESAADDR